MKSWQILEVGKEDMFFSPLTKESDFNQYS